MARQNRPVLRVAVSTTFFFNPFIFSTESYNLAITQSTNIPHLHSVNILAPWLSAETLTSHGSDHLSVVFNLQIPSKEQNIKPPSRYQYQHQHQRRSFAFFITDRITNEPQKKNHTKYNNNTTVAMKRDLGEVSKEIMMREGQGPHQSS